MLNSSVLSDSLLSVVKGGSKLHRVGIVASSESVSACLGEHPHSHQLPFVIAIFSILDIHIHVNIHRTMSGHRPTLNTPAVSP